MNKSGLESSLKKKYLLTGSKFLASFPSWTWERNNLDRFARSAHLYESSVFHGARRDRRGTACRAPTTATEADALNWRSSPESNQCPYFTDVH